MAPGGQRMVAPARGKSDQRSARSTATSFAFLLLALLLGVDGTSLETNDVFLLLPASSAAPANAASTSEGIPEAPTPAAPSPPPTRRPTASSSPRDEGGRRLLVLRPAADIRCYCNLPRCVTTGYMCKSPSGVCFSDLDRTDVELATHGCIELLPSSRQGVCHTTATARKSVPSSPHPSPNCSPNCQEKSKGGVTAEKTSKGTTSPLDTSVMSTSSLDPSPLFSHKGQVVVMLLCCHSDMCNHIDSPEIRLRLTNDSLFVGSSSLGMQQGSSAENGESAGSPALYFGSGHDGWFRVATIAVPICGAFILMLLIFVAFKILRRDSQDQKLRGGGSQRHKQHWRSPSQAWDEEDLCLHHHQCANTQSHLLPLHSDIPEGSPHHSTKMNPNMCTSIPMNAKVHLLSPQQRIEADVSVKKHPKLDYFFLFPRSGKSRKQETGTKKEVPILEETMKTVDAPTAVVVVSVQGVREHM